jgi:hypothetical protein
MKTLIQFFNRFRRNGPIGRHRNVSNTRRKRSQTVNTSDTGFWTLEKLDEVKRG